MGDVAGVRGEAAVGLGLGVAERLVLGFLLPLVSRLVLIFSFLSRGFCVCEKLGSRVKSSWTMSVRQC